MPMYSGVTALGYQPVPQSQRVPRRPRHTFQLKHKPWQLQPFFIGPVIAGETLQNLLLQARVVTDPIKHPLLGWWLEYFFFFVKLRDIEFVGNAVTHPDVERMLIDPTFDHKTSSLYGTSAQAWSYKGTNSIDWVHQCTRRCIECYFRLDGEAWNVAMIDTVPLASINEDEAQAEGTNWMNSMVDATTVTWDEGINVDLNANSVITTAEIDQAMRQWQYQMFNQQTTLTFQEYLKQFGVSVPTEDLHRPELVRFVRLWQYPSNTVNPTDGVPASAVSWSVAERADKDRFISEPGFLFGLTCARPKIYFGKQVDSASMMLTNCWAWMPQLFAADPSTSWRLFKGGATGGASGDRGPLGTTPTNDYWLDIKDLYLYGDQFANFAPGVSDGVVDLPTATLAKRFASSTDVDNLFKNVANNKIRQDGVVSLNILGTQVETSPADQRYT